ncbi:MAG: ABC transporter permease [Vicinamibacteria bacterium]|nr:ABC transporter permease [Vicinamibacteria bacterium]
MRKALAVGIKEFRQIRRDRRTLMILLFIPVFFLLLYGYALNFDIKHVKLAVEDRDLSPESRRLVSAFVNSGYFDQVASVTIEQEIVDLMDRDHIRAALIIPRGLGRDVRRGVPVSVEVIINGENANTATTVMGYASAVITTESARYQMAAPGSPAPFVQLEPRVWYNPDLRSSLFLVPGLLAYIGMITAVVSTALAVVREKERGTMEQVRMAPIGTLPFIVGKSLPYFVVSMTAAVGVVLASMVLFDLPVRGSWWLLLLAMGLYLFGALAMGLFISTVAESQQVAFQIALLSSFLPTMMLSGFIFPIASMPTVLQIVTYVVPARYFLVALRGVLLKGSGFLAVADSLAALMLFAVIVTSLATIRLRREWA